MATSKTLEVIPSARRLMKSLRDMGYDFSAAVADLIDNSIEAGAKNIHINVEFEGDDSWVRIADDGCGIPTQKMKEALRFGTEREYEEDALGKFGLGMKTASLSQCQRLIVASRTNPERAYISSYCWDLDHVIKTNRWEIIPVNDEKMYEVISVPLKMSCGTVILWQRLDRILGYRHPYGEFARKRLLTMCRELETHLGMVFHRFLSGEVIRKKINIYLNDIKISSWDPYALNEKNTIIMEQQEIEFEHEGNKGMIILEPFVLPHQDDFSSPEAFREASGPSSWNQQQGLYIYRANRLIQSGGWCRLRTMDEHTKLARVALKFSPVLDEAFKVNVSKMSVQLPTQIRDRIDKALKPVLKKAQSTYRRKTPDNVKAKPQKWTTDELQAKLIKIAERDERPVIKRVFERFKESN